MGKLIRFEIRKLLRSKYFYVMASIMLGLILFTLLFRVLEYEVPQEGMEPTYSAYLFSRDSLEKSTTIMAIFVSIFACDDFSNTTYKNILAKGYNNTTIYFSKYIVSLAATFLMLGLCWSIGFVSSYAIWGNPLEITDNVGMMALNQVLVIAAYHALFFAVSYGIGKLGGVVTVNILGPGAISLILGIVDLAVDKEDFSMSKYWLDTIFSNAMGQGTDPFVAFISSLFGESIPIDEKLLSAAVWVLLGYTVVFLLLGWLASFRKEAK